MHKLRLSLVIALLVAGCGEDGVEDVDAGNPADQCVGTSDQAILAGFITDGGVGQSTELNDILRACAQSECSGPIVGARYGEATDCMQTCFDDGTDLEGLSEGCTFCWTAGIVCTGQNCVNVCLGTSPDLCEACVLENCVPQRSWCTGL